MPQKILHALNINISRAWHSGSYTLMGKPMKNLELYYPMILFTYFSQPELGILYQ